ncbi:SAM-dependent methyltransferase [Dactylosporangium sp. NPDC000244]|uniref:SAM-dependent methyltransferase n=1 Tax=Dactylosporangium sp. NPDC000244 TaxID=3154365 RepID=UPI003330A7A2
MSLPEWAPDGVDVTVPNAARVYDYGLGGYHNFAVDREFAEQLISAWPGILQVAHTNRAYLGRVVRWLAAQGVRQFLDIGSGIPTRGNVHEVVQAIDPDARVVYVDVDDVAVSHGQAILAGNRYAAAIGGDLRHPAGILGHERVRALIDFDRPVAVLLVAVLHFLGDEDDPPKLVRELTEALVPGSYVAVSHFTAVDDLGHEHEQVTKLYDRTPTSVRTRNPKQVAGILAGLELVEPGVVPITSWHPDPEEPAEHEQRSVLGAVGRKPE